VQGQVLAWGSIPVQVQAQVLEWAPEWVQVLGWWLASDDFYGIDYVRSKLCERFAIAIYWRCDDRTAGWSCGSRSDSSSERDRV
jgi:hypothetical protein